MVKKVQGDLKEFKEIVRGLKGLKRSNEPDVTKLYKFPVFNVSNLKFFLIH